jgi:propionyl-CoA synthetase
VPVGLTLLKDGVNISEADLQAELVAMVQKEIDAVACFGQILIVERLLKTRSGKLLHKLLRQIAENHEFVIPSTIDAPVSIDEIKAIIQNNGLEKPIG